MAITRYREWLCDRCGALLQLDPVEQPVGWVRVDVVIPPLASKNTGVSGSHLCSDCNRALRLFLTGED